MWRLFLLIGLTFLVIASARAEAPKRVRGRATALETRPDHFPHRIWAACDFESRLPDYAWFGPAESKNIPAYPGNATSLGVKAKPYGNFAALMTGINPVPGPCMGKVNKMYCRYLLRGGNTATFQHFSLTREDNNHIVVSGLNQAQWSEVTLNFTRDAARNDGSAEAFARGERMDDLKVFVGKPKDGQDYELFLDDVIFFDDDPNQPRDSEPFPRRVIYVAGFDTGVDPKSRPKYFPGEMNVLPNSKAPPDSYWGVAEAVPQKEGKGRWIRLQVEPPKSVGAHTKLRFRYFLKGTSKITAQIFDVTDQDNRHVVLKDLPRDKWQFIHVDFTRDGKKNDGKQTPFAAGHKVDDIFFFVDEGELLVDEVVLYDAGEKGK